MGQRAGGARGERSGKGWAAAGRGEGGPRGAHPELQTEQNKLIKEIEKESKKKAAENPKTKEERIADLGSGTRRRSTRTRLPTTRRSRSSPSPSRRRRRTSASRCRPGRLPEGPLRGVQEPQRQAAHRRGPEVPGPARALRRLLRGRHGRRDGPRAAAEPRPRRRGRGAPRDDQDLQGTEAEQGHQEAQGRIRVPQDRQPARSDDNGRHPGHPARPAPDGAARRRPLRDLAT